MKQFAIVFAVLGTLFQAGAAQAAKTVMSGESLELANAMFHCQVEVAKVAKSASVQVFEASHLKLNDADVYEVIFANVVGSPMQPPYGVGVLTISSRFQPINCPAGAADCGGGHTVYSCKLHMHDSSPQQDLPCTLDIGAYGWPSACQCSQGDVYDPRVGSCFSAFVLE